MINICIVIPPFTQDVLIVSADANQQLNCLYDHLFCLVFTLSMQNLWTEFGENSMLVCRFALQLRCFCPALPLGHCLHFGGKFAVMKRLEL